MYRDRLLGTLIIAHFDDSIEILSISEDLSAANLARGRTRRTSLMHTPLLAKDIMVTRLVTLSPGMDVYDAIGLLLKHRISGAPVVDEVGLFLGVFSEKCCMSVLVKAAYESLPTSQIDPFIDTEARTITEEADLLSIVQVFLNTESRRLPVLRSGRLVGQISRRDVLKAAHKMIDVAPGKDTDLLYLSSIFDRNEAPIAQ